MTFAVYMRVSTDKQDSANQEPDLRRLVEAREGAGAWERVALFVETASAMKDRPAFDRMLEAARLGKLRRLYVWALDRFGRNQFQTMRDLTTLVDTYGVAVASVRESWVESTADPLTRRLVLSVMTWAAEAEWVKLKGRTRAGLDRARVAIATKGSHVSSKSGRTITALGRPRVVIPERALAKACELRQALGDSSGASWRAIAAELERLGLGKWGHGNLANQCHKRVATLPAGKPGSAGGWQKPGTLSGKGRF